jgi:hypothetical protein
LREHEIVERSKTDIERSRDQQRDAKLPKVGSGTGGPEAGFKVPVAKAEG